MKTGAGATAASATLLRAALDSLQAGILWVDAGGTICDANATFAAQGGVAAASLPGQPLSAFFRDLASDGWTTLWAKLATDGHHQRIHILHRPDAAPISLKVTWQCLSDATQTLACGQTELFADEQQADAVSRLQHAVLEAVAMGRPLKVVLDLLCRQVDAMAPDVMCSVLQVDRAGILHPCAAPSLPAAYSAALEGVPIGPNAGSCGTAAWRGQSVEVTDIAHDPLWQDYRALALPYGLAACWSSPIKTRDGRVVGTFALYYREPRGASPFHRQMVEACLNLCTLAIEHEETAAEIHRLAFMDTLTGLPNRMLLRDRAGESLALAHRLHQPLTLMFLDLDRFKNVNDSLGHSVGDKLLGSIAERLQDAVRDTDTVARLGGDEFVVLLPNCDAMQATTVAEKLIERLSARIEIADLSLTPTASIGIAQYPEDGQDFDALLKNADTAMYKAKEGGRNRFHFFRREMNEHATRRLEMEAALREALSRQELTLHYQPKLRLADGGLHGVEALVRWQHPQWGAIPPDQFVPLAEECGLINALDAWVLETALHQLATWEAGGIVVPRIAVNVSAARFSRDNVPQHVARSLAANALQPDRLILEITERLVLSNDSGVSRALDALHATGVALSIDDFGTGYSSLSYLKRFPVSELKIDRSFINEMDSSAADRSLVRAVIQIGASLGLSVVAEGVERDSQHAMLIAEGCAIGQGYHYARPLPPAALAAWVQARNR